MSFTDVIKKSVLEGFKTDIGIEKVAYTMGLVTVLGIYIYFVYRYKTKASFYSKDFNIVLAILPIITAGIVLAMQSNIVISLGMVGALSIVRFRNAIKSSMDLVFVFWSISVGIICGGGVYFISLIVSFIITIVLFIFDYIPVRKKSLLLIVNGSNIEIEKEIVAILREKSSKYKVKSRNIHDNNIDLIIELRSKKETEIIRKCSNIKNVDSVNLISHDGEERL